MIVSVPPLRREATAVFSAVVLLTTSKARSAPRSPVSWSISAVTLLWPACKTTSAPACEANAFAAQDPQQ